MQQFGEWTLKRGLIFFDNSHYNFVILPIVANKGGQKQQQCKAIHTWKQKKSTISTQLAQRRDKNLSPQPRRQRGKPQN